MYSSNGALGCGPKVSTSFMNPSTNIKAITSGRPLLAPDMDKKKTDERSEEFLKEMYGPRIKGIKNTQTFLRDHLHKAVSIYLGSKDSEPEKTADILPRHH